jgi:hypothetical protein
MDIREALAKQRKPRDEGGRIMLDDGMLSISDEVFSIALWMYGASEEERRLLSNEPLEKRQDVLKEWSKNNFIDRGFI